MAAALHRFIQPSFTASQPADQLRRRSRPDPPSSSSMVITNADAAPATFPLPPPAPPRRVFQPFVPIPSPHAATPFSAPTARLPPPPPPPQHTYRRVINRHAMAPPPQPQVPGLQVRLVTAENYEAELDGIGFLLPRYPYVAIDTEYPGTVHRPPPPWMAQRDHSPPERYALVKANVDEIPVVQLGITLCDEFGNRPTFVDGGGRQHELAWEVTFSDFDARRHRHAPESVAFLQSRGLDFDHARAAGVSSAVFAAKLAAVLSSLSARRREELTWAAFGGAHDFAYVVKMLAGGRPLPGTWHEFAALAGDLLGGRVFDAKYMAEHCERADLSGGGLRGVATSLRVRHDLPKERPAWLAGRKSYVASRVFTAMRRNVMYRDGGASRQGLIDGLHL